MTVVSIFETGLYEYDLHLALVPLARAQYLLATDDVVNRIDVNVKDLNHAPEVAMRILEKLGPKYDVESWEDRTKSVFQGLKLERLGLAIAIGLIVFVAALNIVATLTMMVLEKTRDIATLMAMGATLSQIRRVFMLQGVIIGIVGTAVGVVLGHAVSYTVDTYKLIWLDPALYTIDHLPFSAGIGDTVIIAAAAIFISFLATLYPSAAAAKLQPVEALRYE
jgi:lipoprotein-releasing system permease protein